VQSAYILYVRSSGLIDADYTDILRLLRIGMNVQTFNHARTYPWFSYPKKEALCSTTTTPTSN
jgi:hypothetical protein